MDYSKSLITVAIRRAGWMRMNKRSYTVNKDAEGVSQKCQGPSVDKSRERHLWTHAQALTQTHRMLSLHLSYSTFCSLYGRDCQQGTRCVYYKSNGHIQIVVDTCNQASQHWDKNVTRLYLWMMSFMNTVKLTRTWFDIQNVHAFVTRLTHVWCTYDVIYAIHKLYQNVFRRSPK